MPPPVLWHLEISHYNEKARWALDHKRVAHVRRAVTPGLQELTARRLRAGRTTPVLELDDGAIGDSARIIEELERRWPEPPLYPADAGEREQAVALQAHFDDEVGPAIRRVLFADMLTEPRAFVAMFAGPDARRIGVVESLLPRVVTWRYGLDPEIVEASRATVRSAFDLVEAEVGPSGHLVGDAFTVADLAAASILGLVVLPPELAYTKLPADERSAAFRRFRDSLKARPGFAWVEEIYRRHRGTSAEVAAG